MLIVRIIWWTLLLIARKLVPEIYKDVLIVQIFTIVFEFAFPTSGWILDFFRSSLNANMIEAMICHKN